MAAFVGWAPAGLLLAVSTAMAARVRSYWDATPGRSSKMPLGLDPVAVLPLKEPLIIVGAGPVGLCAALAMRQIAADAKILVLEKRSKVAMIGPTDSWFAFGLATPVLQFLMSLGIEDLDWESLRINGTEIHFHLPWHLAKQSGGVSYPVRRGFLLNLLLKRAHAQGVDVRFEQEVRQVDLPGQSITLEDSPLPVKFGWLIGADGVHSVVRQALDAEGLALGHSCSAKRSTEMWMASTLPSSALPWPQDRLHIVMHGLRKATAVIFVRSEGRWSLVTSFPEEPVGAADKAITAVDHFVKRLATNEACGLRADVAVSDLIRTREFGNWSLVNCTRFHSSSHRALLVGDAAHAVVSHGGEGLNLGLTGVHELYKAVKRAGGFTERAVTIWEERWGLPMRSYWAKYLHPLAAHGSGAQAVLFKLVAGPRPKLFESTDLADMVRTFHA